MDGTCTICGDGTTRIIKLTLDLTHQHTHFACQHGFAWADPSGLIPCLDCEPQMHERLDAHARR